MAASPVPSLDIVVVATYELVVSANSMAATQSEGEHHEPEPTPSMMKVRTCLIAGNCLTEAMVKVSRSNG